jgi:hypothetical protein
MQRKLKKVASPINATQLPWEQNLKLLNVKTINDSIEEHENCNPQTLNLLPLYCNACKNKQCPQNSHLPIFGKYLKGVSLHFPLHLQIYYSCS